jgi:hypothetical protein
MFKRLLPVLAITLILSSCNMWKNPPKGWAGATGGEQLERLLWDDIKAKNWKDVDQHLEPNFIATTSTARFDKAASLERWKAYELQSVSLADVQVQTAGADFIVTATMTASGTAGGKPIASEPIKTMTVWQQVSKGWVAVAHTDSLP